jgi:DNA polymerase-3 subunit delta'
MLFSDVFVNDVVKKKLINTVINQRVSHTQLFLGTEGSHTLALAIAYAQYINCKNRSATDACGVCESCVKYRHLAHPDLHFYFPTATNNTVKDKPISSDFIMMNGEKCSFHRRCFLLKMIGTKNWS